MVKFLRVAIPLIVLIGIGIYSLVPYPTLDPAKLHAVAMESRELIAIHQSDAPRHSVNIPQEKWPPAIASLEPYSVTVEPEAVEILVRPYLDGGWGYGFAIDKRNLTMLVECWSDLGQNMYWHSPC